MSDHVASAQPKGYGRLIRGLIFLVVSLVIIAFGLGPAGAQFVAAQLQRGHLHAPNLQLIAEAPLVVQLHLVTVLVGFAVGTAQMLGVKGTAMHRTMGWVFVIFLMFTAADALFIKNGPNWGPNPIQLFSLVTLVMLPLGVLAARRHNVIGHARAMTGVYWGGMIIAGLLTFIPGRLMWRVFFG